MPIEVILEYKRVGTSMTSRGRILSKEGGLVTEEGDFDGLEFKPMMRQLAEVLAYWPVDEVPELDVFVQRTDREGLLPYKLDQRTVYLLRTDPVAGFEALSFTSASPTVAEERVKRELQPSAPPTLRTGTATVADAFGEFVAFRVRNHELECPGCGFWGVYSTPGLLNDPDRVGQTFKTVFVCPKKCRERFVVTCHKEWGFVRVDDLLDRTRLPAFYFPRAWNGGRPWVSREDLQQKYLEYKKEKESIL